MEIGVGLFLLIGLACLGYVSFTLGHLQLFGGKDYDVKATFSNVAGLKDRALVSMAGVKIGEVKKVSLYDGQAQVILKIVKDVKLEDDSIASIKTMGIIGDKYVSITPGASDVLIKPGGTIRDTQPPMDFESLIGRFVFGGMDQGKQAGEKKSPEESNK